MEKPPSLSRRQDDCDHAAAAQEASLPTPGGPATRALTLHSGPRCTHHPAWPTGRTRGRERVSLPLLAAGHPTLG